MKRYERVPKLGSTITNLTIFCEGLVQGIGDGLYLVLLCFVNDLHSLLEGIPPRYVGNRKVPPQGLLYNFGGSGRLALFVPQNLKSYRLTVWLVCAALVDIDYCDLVQCVRSTPLVPRQVQHITRGGVHGSRKVAEKANKVRTSREVLFLIFLSILPKVA